MRRDVAILSGNGAEEALDFRTEFHGRLLDLLGSGKDGLRRAARLRHPGRDIAKRGDHGLAPRGGAGDVVRNLPGRQFLLLDGAGNLGGVGIDLLIRRVIAPIAVTAAWVEPWTEEISRVISSVAFAVCTASDFTSEATTAKPRPAAPARAASIVALSARRFVCSAMS